MYFSVGNRVTGLDRVQCPIFDVVEEEGYIFINMPEKMLEDLSLKCEYEFAFGQIKNTLMICMKNDYLGWMSMPYSPHLSSGKFSREYKEGTGITVNIILIRSEDSRIVDINTVVLTNEFSNELGKSVNEILENDYNGREHGDAVDTVYRNFETDDELAFDLPIRCMV